MAIDSERLFESSSEEQSDHIDLIPSILFTVGDQRC